MESDEQQVEALKKWWQENGRVVVLGLVVGLGGVSGWNYWQHYQRVQAEEASQLYTELVNAVDDARYEEAVRQANLVIQEYPDSGYASLAALVGARAAHAANQPGQVRANLDYVLANAPEPGWRELARVRLARVLVHEGDPSGAVAQLDQVTDPAFGPVAAEIRGDALVAQGEHEAARAAYQSVLDEESILAATRGRVRMKLDDLGRLDVE